MSPQLIENIMTFIAVIQYQRNICMSNVSLTNRKLSNYLSFSCLYLIVLKMIYNSPVPYISAQQMHGQHGHRRSISSSSSSSSSSTSSSTSSSSSSSSTDTSAHRPGHKRDTKRKPRPSKRVAPTGDRSKLKKTKSASSS